MDRRRWSWVRASHARALTNADRTKCRGDNHHHRCGCHKGYCWARCNGSQWCYTTPHHSQSYVYIRCGNNEQCYPSWSCAGPCTAGR